MTKDEIIAMSKQFWLTGVGADMLSRGWDVEITLEDLEKIIHLVEQQEREKCARLCDELDQKLWAETSEPMSGYGEAIRETK